VSRRGFTLIEVLVVVAIIALLLAIMLPSLAEARFNAKSVACKANLHDLGTGFTIYAETYRGYLSFTDGPGSDSFYSLYKAKLLRDVNVLICPASRNRIRGETLTWPEINKLGQSGVWTSPEDDNIVVPHLQSGNEISDIDEAAKYRDDEGGGHSYENNAVYDSDSHGGRPVSDLCSKHKRTSHFLVPPYSMMLVHDNDNRNNDVPIPALDCHDSLFDGNNCPQTWDNHGKRGLNMMFADGHADWVKKFTAPVVDLRGTNPKGTPPAPKISKNGTVDKIWLKSQYPWRYR
jgi:prepilin-type N-terminal cleavage/methylation domain-containing protein/prepilin-type processing-associated H-X9-DG protein